MPWLRSIRLAWPVQTSKKPQPTSMAFLSIPVLAFVVLSGLALYKFIIYPTFLSPLSKVPNAHWSAQISPLWILWTRFYCHENEYVHAAHLKHGSVIQLAPNELSINDIGGLRTVYAGGFEKGQWYSIFDNYGSAATPFIPPLSQILTYKGYPACSPPGTPAPTPPANA